MVAHSGLARRATRQIEKASPFYQAAEVLRDPDWVHQVPAVREPRNWRPYIGGEQARQDAALARERGVDEEAHAHSPARRPEHRVHGVICVGPIADLKDRVRGESEVGGEHGDEGEDEEEDVAGEQPEGRKGGQVAGRRLPLREHEGQSDPDQERPAAAPGLVVVCSAKRLWI